MYKTVEEVKYTFDNDNYIEKDSYGEWYVFTGTHGEAYRTEEEAVAEWMKLWNEWHDDYCRSSKKERLHADLTALAQHKLDETSPLEIIERKYNCDYVYDLKGCIEMKNLTEDDLIDVLENIGE